MPDRDPEQRREWDARYRAAHREERSEYNARYRSTHFEERRESDARYRAAHREREREKSARYRAAHLEKERERGARYENSVRGQIKRELRVVRSRIAVKQQRLQELEVLLGSEI